MIFLVIFALMTALGADRPPKHSKRIHQTRNWRCEDSEVTEKAMRQMRSGKRDLNKPNRREARLMANCHQLWRRHCRSGVYYLKIGSEVKLTYCHIQEDGGWTMVHQHGFPNADQWGCYKKYCKQLSRESWNKTMGEYTDGFGYPTYQMSDYWLGLAALHKLTRDGKMEAKIELIDWENETKEARYGKFMVDDGIYGYKLTARNFQKELSQVGDAFAGLASDTFCKDEKCALDRRRTKDLTRQNNALFSTPDVDNDNYCRPVKQKTNGHDQFNPEEEHFCRSTDELSCAKKDNTGFWYNSCAAVNLNGRIFKSSDENLKNKDGMIWAGKWHKENYSLIYSAIYIKPVKND